MQGIDTTANPNAFKIALYSVPGACAISSGQRTTQLSLFSDTSPLLTAHLVNVLSQAHSSFRNLVCATEQSIQMESLPSAVAPPKCQLQTGVEQQDFPGTPQGTYHPKTNTHTYYLPARSAARYINQPLSRTAGGGILGCGVSRSDYPALALVPPPDLPWR